jgi:HEAT repeat protein
MPGWSRLALGLTLLLVLSVGLVGCQVETSEGQSPVSALLAKLVGGSSAEKREKLINDLLSPDADVRREAVLKLGQGEAARWDVTPKILKNRALGDESPLVRAAAVQVYAQLIESEELPEVLSKAADDIDMRVRMEAAAALSNRWDTQSMEILLKLLENDEETAIRTQAAGGLVNFRDRKSVRGLTEALDDDEFSVSYRARQSLMELTGQDFGYDRQAWQEWFYATEKVFNEE